MLQKYNGYRKSWLANPSTCGLLIQSYIILLIYSDMLQTAVLTSNTYNKIVKSTNSNNL